jgi:hypothetical protein
MTDPLIAAAQFLVTQLDWLRHARDEMGQPYAASVFAEIRDCASRMRAVVEGPADRRYLGPCGAPYLCDGIAVGDQGQPWAECGVPDSHPAHELSTCEGDVYARDGAPAGHCRTCGAEVDTGERRAWLDAEVRSHTFRAIHIAQAYRISVDTIRSWAHRGLLVPHGHDADERPLFNVGDVLDLAAADAARREQARARRAAARQTAEMGAAA